MNPVAGAPVTLAPREARPAQSATFDPFLLLLASRRYIVRVALLVALVAVAVTLLQKRLYTANASFLPQGRKGAASLASLAAQLGVGMPSVSDAGQSPAFYADLVKSRSVLNPIVGQQFALANGSRATIAQAADISDSKGPAWLHAKVLDWLLENVSVSSSPRTGVVSISATSPDPQLSLQLVNALLDGVSRFNFESRQSQATAERKFTEKRVADARDDLRNAEEQLADFERGNRIASAPSLTQTRARLEREVTLRAQVYTSLSQAYEQAKIEEVRDTPVITVIEAAELPVKPNGRGTVMRLITGLFLGAVAGFALGYLRRNRLLDGIGARERERLFAETLADLKRPWRLMYRPSTTAA